jgi:hypothetical protein
VERASSDESLQAVKAILRPQNKAMTIKRSIALFYVHKDEDHHFYLSQVVDVRLFIIN